MTFDPTSVEVTRVTLPKDHCVQVPWKYIKVCGYSDLFLQKTWTKGHWSLDDLWLHICWGHMCDSTQGSLSPSPMGILSTSMYVDTVINFANYRIHTHTTYILHRVFSLNFWWGGGLKIFSPRRSPTGTKPDGGGDLQKKSNWSQNCPLNAKLGHFLLF